MDQILVERLREQTPSLDLERGGDAASAKGVGGRFAEIVSGLVAEVNAKQNLAADRAEGLARGEVGLMDTVVAINDADLSLRMMMQIRDRALDAYQRLLRTI
jgi:flagellar hook-basal body complex protein FliE